MIEPGPRIEICAEHGPSCQLDYGFRLMVQFDLKRAVLRSNENAEGIDRVEIGYDTLWWVVHGGDMYDCENTRADAAQAIHKKNHHQEF